MSIRVEPIDFTEPINFTEGFAFINGALYTDRHAFEQELEALYEAGEEECDIVIVDNIYELTVDIPAAKRSGEIEKYGEAAFAGRIKDRINNPEWV